jgi:hypothetical protein
MLKIRISIHTDSIVEGLTLCSSYALDAEVNDLEVISVSSEINESRELPYTFAIFINDELEDEHLANMDRVKELAEMARHSQMAADEAAKDDIPWLDVP